MKSKKFTVGLLVFYLLILTWIIVFKLEFSLSELDHVRNVNLLPFRQSVIVNGTIDFTEIIQNVLAFIPFGVLIHTLLEKKPIIIRALPIFLVSLMFEITQFIFSVGASDITDLISNTLGGMIGIAVALIISKGFKKNWVELINIFSAVCAIGLTALVGMLMLANL